MHFDDEKMNKRKSTDVDARVDSSDTLYFPDSLLDDAAGVSPKSAQDLISSKFHQQIRDGEPVKTSWTELEKCSEAEKDKYGGAVYRAEELSSHFVGAIDLMNRNLFMRDKSEWEENKFTESKRIYVPEALEAITSRDLKSLSILFQVKSNLVEGVCLPPWQAIYPGPLTEFGDSRGTQKNNTNKKLVKIATGVTLNVSNEPSPENFKEGVALAVRPAESFDVNARFAPRRGDHDFEVEPIFTHEAWRQALEHVMDDVSLIRSSRSKDQGVYGFGLFDIANSGTSFMLGYMMVMARETCIQKGLGESTLLPLEGEAYRILGDTIQIKDVVVSTGWGEERSLAVTMTLDPLKHSPIVRVRNS